MRPFFLLLILCFSLGFAAVFGALDILRPAVAQSMGLRLGSPTPPNAPGVPSFQFQDSTGKSIDLSEFRGRYILINLWATWCGPCAAEMPSLDALSQQFPADRLAIVAIAEDHDGLATARYFYLKRGLKNLGLYADPTGQTISLLHAKGLPTTLLVDPDGHELKRFEGAENWMAPKMLAYLKSVIH